MSRNGTRIAATLTFLNLTSTRISIRQAKISTSKVLYIHLTQTSSEVLKNLVLAGVRPVLCDSRPYPEAILETPSFFVLHKDKKRVRYSSVAHAMKESVEELNPLLGECEILETSVSDITEDMLKGYSMVIASHIGKNESSRLAKATTSAGGSFFMVDCFGWDGAAVIDLGPEHTFRPEIKDKKLGDLQTLVPYIPTEEIWNVPIGDIIPVKRIDKTPPPVWIKYRAILEYQTKTKTWPSAEKADDFCMVVEKWIAEEAPHLKDLDIFQPGALTKLALVATAEMAPICATLGGIIGNEVIKAISGKGEPSNNVLLFEGVTGRCRNVLVKSKSKES